MGWWWWWQKLQQDAGQKKGVSMVVVEVLVTRRPGPGSRPSRWRQPASKEAWDLVDGGMSTARETCNAWACSCSLGFLCSTVCLCFPCVNVAMDIISILPCCKAMDDGSV